MTPDTSSRPATTLRRARVVLMLGLLAVEGVAGYDLWTVDTGVVATTDTMLPVGALYDIAGFWQTLLWVQVACAALWVGLARWIAKREDAAR